MIKCKDVCCEYKEHTEEHYCCIYCEKSKSWCCCGIAMENGFDERKILENCKYAEKDFV